MSIRSWIIHKIFLASKKDADDRLRNLDLTKLSLPKEKQRAEAGRKYFNQFSKLYGWITRSPKGVVLESFVRNGVKGVKAMPSSPGDQIILYLHGGGFRIGLEPLHTTFAAEVARVTQTPVWAVDYRLAPEHPFPAALEDAFSMYKSLLDEGQSIILMGDSAGGNLILSLMLMLKEEGLPMPANAIAISPSTDGCFTGESFLTLNDADPVLSTRYCKYVWAVYLWGEKPDNPLASPLYGDLSGLPPLLILVGGQEVLLDDSRQFAAKAKAAGVDVTLDVVEHMWHDYPLFYGLYDEGQVAVGKIAEFVNSKRNYPIRDTTETFKHFRQRNTLGDLEIKDLIEEGRQPEVDRE